MVYSPDALVEDEKRGVDAKCAFMEQRRKWGWEAHEIPMRVQMQCFWYCAAMDYPVWDVAAFLGDGMPRIYTVERLDAAHERMMLHRAEEWWRRYIEGDEQPPFDDSGEAHQWLQRTYPAHRPDTIREATDEESELLRRYIITRIAEQKIKDAVASHAVAIKRAIGDAEGLRWGDGHLLTWRKARDSKGTDWESMATALLHNYVKDPAERLALYDRYATTRTGSRRIHVNHPSLRKDDATAALAA